MERRRWSSILSSNRHARYLTVIAILLLALALRARNLDYGLPLILPPDEPTIVDPALRMADLASFNLDPGFYNYPTLQIYLLSASFVARAAVGPLTGKEYSLPIRSAAIRQARWITTVIGVASVLVVYLLGVAHSGPLAGILAALLMALTPYHIAHSHYANVDIPMTFWLLAAYLFAHTYVRSRRLAHYLMAAVAIGLAGATKYTGLLMMPVLPVAVLLADRMSVAGHVRRKKKGKVGKHAARTILLGVLLCALVYTLCAPYSLLRFQDFVGALVFEREHMQEGHWGYDLEPGGWQFHRFVYQWLVGLPFVLGVPLYLVSMTAMIVLLVPRRRALILPLAATLPIVVAVCLATVVFPRYLVPWTPVAALLSATWLARVIVSPWRLARYAGALLLGVVCVYNAVFSVSLLNGLKLQNTVQGINWIARNVPALAEIGVGQRTRMFGFPRDRYRPEIIDLRGAIEGTYRPQWMVMTGPYRDPWKRGDQAYGPANRFFRTLDSGAEYERVAFFETRYFNEGLYAWLDPILANEFLNPDVMIYRRRGGPGPTTGRSGAGEP